jgi:hypothetical protein
MYSACPRWAWLVGAMQTQAVQDTKQALNLSVQDEQAGSCARRRVFILSMGITWSHLTGEGIKHVQCIAGRKEKGRRRRPRRRRRHCIAGAGASAAHEHCTGEVSLCQAHANLFSLLAKPFSLSVLSPPAPPMHPCIRHVHPDPALTRVKATHNPRTNWYKILYWISHTFSPYYTIHFLGENWWLKKK